MSLKELRIGNFKSGSNTFSNRIKLRWKLEIFSDCRVHYTHTYTHLYSINRDRSKGSKDALCKKWSISVRHKWYITIELSIIHIYVARFAQCRIFRAPPLARGFSPLAGLIYAAHAAPRYPTHVSGMTVQVVEIQAWYFVSRPSVNIARPRKICEITSQPCHGWMGYGITSNSGRDIFQDEQDSSLRAIFDSRDGRFLFYFFIVSDDSVIDQISILFHSSFVSFCVYCITNRWNFYITS